ncbi:unnamed protein product [Phytophthora lilii]|uniref:Unnamed protein product n=1 Tax=Phytophthora lilii TaxID=2077276 RepID=A0A9W6WMU1_9STRA|nr:unnamed protein product [Phytophthora lilii]
MSSSTTFSIAMQKLTLCDDVKSLLSPRERLSDLHDHRRHHGEGHDCPRDVGAEARTRAALPPKVVERSGDQREQHDEQALKRNQHDAKYFRGGVKVKHGVAKAFAHTLQRFTNRHFVAAARIPRVDDTFTSGHGCCTKRWCLPIVRPEDFIVREISAAGEVVGFSDDSDRLPTESEREAVLRKIEAAQLASQKEKKERLVFDAPADGWRAALTELIGATILEDVERVATGKTDDYFLESPTEFRDRVYLQVCIQNCFPGLDCKMQKAPAEDDQLKMEQIQVLLDPVYKKLRNGGMSVENCNRLLTFLRNGVSDPAASKGKTLCYCWYF